MDSRRHYRRLLQRRSGPQGLIDPVARLDSVERDGRVRVVRVSGRPLLNQRLAALGVVPGAEITVVKPRCPTIVGIGGARIAVGRSAAECVEVERLAIPPTPVEEGGE